MHERSVGLACLGNYDCYSYRWQINKVDRRIVYANYVVNSTFQVGHDYSRDLRVTRNNPFNCRVERRRPG